jgi:vancomycin resistance protein YoaR
MAVRANSRQRESSFTHLLFQLIVALVSGALIFFLLTGALVLGFNLYFGGKIYPGVSVAGVNLSGLTLEEASSLLYHEITYPNDGKVVFQEGENLWAANPQELGLVFDAQSSARAAYNTGRSGDPFSRVFNQAKAWRSGIDLAPLLVYDEAAAVEYVNEIAQQVDKATIEASLTIEGVTVTENPGQVGRKVDVHGTLVSLKESMQAMTDSLITVQVEEIPPQIQDVSAAAETARRIVSQPLTLYMPDPGEEEQVPWRIEADQLGRMLLVEQVETPEGRNLRVRFDENALYTYLNALGPDIARNPQNARFIFNDDTRLLEVIQPAVIGRVLDVHATIMDITQKVPEGQHEIALNVSTIEPTITDDTTGEELGITELVSWHTSYFRGSISERMNNIEVAAANFHGLLVPPGETFSMADVMGNVSLDSGYSEAWIIFGGRTIKGVGGGVCQVSTTLFRTVFFGGYPIVERYPHAYRVGYYEQTVNGHDDYMAGLDATVFVPLVDFKFMNDTPYWLLMETYFNPTARSLTWKFYSTSDGREVEWDSSGPTHVVEPPEPKFEENPELAQGEIVQVDWAAEGADVTVNRTVTRDGVILYDDVITTHYQPWQDVYQYGPGTELKDKKFFWKKKQPQG